MKNKYWVMLLAAIAVWCLVLTLGPSSNAPASEAQIKSGDTVITVDLQTEQEFTLEVEGGGYNTVTVRNGKIAVIEANCPDHYCVKQGFCNSGRAIVCLPNKLVISFSAETGIDGSVG